MLSESLARPPIDIAFYYPGRSWVHESWLKGVLLFFDGVGLQIPTYMELRAEDDPIYAWLLREGILHLFAPEQLLDTDARRHVASTLADMLHNGFFDDLPRESNAFREMSLFQLQCDDPDLNGALYEELESHELLRPHRPGPLIAVAVFDLLLVLYAHLMHPVSLPNGMMLSPATDSPTIFKAFSDVLSVRPSCHRASIVLSDLDAVAPDLRHVSIDEILAFRREHLAQYRVYARTVRAFARELNAVSASERDAAYRDRLEEIRDLAVDLGRITQSAWKKPASIVLSFAGAVWTLATGDPLGALLAAGATAMQLDADATEVCRYSYLFDVKTGLARALPGVR